jgi:hypothetical protein
MDLIEYIEKTFIENAGPGGKFMKHDKGKIVWTEDFITHFDTYEHPIFSNIAVNLLHGVDLCAYDLKIYLELLKGYGYFDREDFERFLDLGDQMGYGRFNFLNEIENFDVDQRIINAYLRHYTEKNWYACICNLLMLYARKIKRENNIWKSSKL